MKENRSFDHYFGSLSGVRGFDDPQRSGSPMDRPCSSSRTRCIRKVMCCRSGSIPRAAVHNACMT
ncbi:MAG TPA: alkaline phosphatase family protein [Acetobacteraceae bacterium]|nr:alkaline phosphatase family protein [Acetobacteraceae bacterium]